MFFFVFYRIGTELYDPERGGFVDLSILDVLQIFGRAGRPQFDTSGHAVLITPHKSLSSYLGAFLYFDSLLCANCLLLPLRN